MTCLEKPCLKLSPTSISRPLVCLSIVGRSHSLSRLRTSIASLSNSWHTSCSCDIENLAYFMLSPPQAFFSYHRQILHY